MITIGRGLNPGGHTDFGHFDLAHFVVYLRSLTEVEMSVIPEIPWPVSSTDELTCCIERQGIHSQF